MIHNVDLLRKNLGLFDNEDINQQTAYQMALAIYIRRSTDDVIGLAVKLLQEIITSRGWESSSGTVRTFVLKVLMTSF